AARLAAHHRVGVGLARRPQPEAALERLEDRVVDVLGERRLRRLVVERQNRDGLDVRQAAAGEAVEARREREGEGASDGRARSRDRTSPRDRKSTRLNSSHQIISYAVFCLKKKKQNTRPYSHT